jgi:GntR family transcriptional repressor for pyruvate dehydrogenase complex
MRSYSMLSDDTPRLPPLRATRTSPGQPSRLGAIPRQPRLSDKVADGILELIVSNRLKPGDTLPPERELGEQFGVSRTVIREAVRALDAKGLVEVRSGSRIRIGAVDAATAGESLRHFIRGSELQPDTVVEVRSALVVTAAGLGAIRADGEDLKRLRAAQTELERHRALASASRNELLMLIGDSLDAALAEMPSPRAAQPPGAAWRDLVDAIERRDPAAARSEASRYLELGP